MLSRQQFLLTLWIETMTARNFAIAFGIALIISLAGQRAEGRTLLVRRADGSVLKIYEVSYSRNGHYYVRGKPISLPTFGGSNLVEVFDAKLSPNPRTADKPIWKTRIRGWNKLYVDNDGDTVVSVLRSSFAMASTEDVISSLGVSAFGVVAITNRAKSGKTRRRYRIHSLTNELTKWYDGINTGDVVLPPLDGYATYGWYRKATQKRNRLKLLGYGRESTFNLSTGRRLR